MPYLGNVPSSFNVGTNNIDNGAVTTEKIADGAVVNTDVNASAAIAGTKISPDFGSQNLLTTGTATAASLIPTSSTAPTNGFFLPAANTVGISTNGSGRLFINSSGDIGLGTNSPDVFGRFYARTIGLSSSGSTAIQINSATGSTAIIDFGVNSSRTGGITSNVSRTALSTLTASPLVFETDSSERFRITSAGLVGIGTNSPSNDLDILKTASGSTTTARIGATATTGANNATLILNNGGTGNATLRFDYEGSTNRASIGVLASDQKLTFGTAGSTAMTIDASQRLGIGTTSPAVTTHISSSSAEVLRLQHASTPYQSFYLGSNRGAYILSNVSYLEISAESTSNNTIMFSTSGAEKARLDSSGRLLVGTSTARSAGSGSGIDFQVEGAPSPCNIGAIRNSNNAFPARVLIAKTRGGSVGSNTVVQSGDSLGLLEFDGADGTQLIQGAGIEAFVDGTPGTNDMPTRLVFSVTRDGASSPTEAARINNAGYFKATSDGTYHSSTGSSHELRQTTSGNDTLLLTSTNASLAAGIFEASATRGNNSAYNFFRGWSGGFSDLEFNLRGDGNAFADGTWSGGGADYAEFFEWVDSNLNEEDRRGISVVLDGDKIREAVTGEDPIGVISGNPSVVGDAAWNKWSGKYLRDEFGSYLLDQNGDRQLNSVYDPDQEYIPREQRPEWDCVGLMGKLRIRKGQVTGSRWIKMRDISDTVEEWLVR